jgi:hypothetical protein
VRKKNAKNLTIALIGLAHPPTAALIKSLMKPKSFFVQPKEENAESNKVNEIVRIF